MSDKKIQYTTRPATDLDYQYCYKLTKENMFELFSRHWGGWGRIKYDQLGQSWINCP